MSRRARAALAAGLVGSALWVLMPAARAETGGGPPASDEANAALIDPAGDTQDAAAGPDAQSRERALMLGDDQAANDPRGYEPSLYTGKWYMPGLEDTRQCIIERESHANYRASNGVFHGAYQMSAALGDGAAWMMQREVRKELGDQGVDLMQQLRRTTPNNWSRYWQDRAFWTIWRNGAGRHHWGSGISGC